MTRMMALVIALVACTTCVGAASFGAGLLGPWLQAHIMVVRWFAPACSVFAIGSGVFAAARRKKNAAEDDVRLTPLVRRDPATGLRQL